MIISQISLWTGFIGLLRRNSSVMSYLQGFIKLRRQHIYVIFKLIYTQNMLH